MNKEYRNHTGNTIKVKNKNNQLVEFKKEELLVYVEYKEKEINNEIFKIVKQSPKEIINLPPEKENVLIIVSIQVLEAAKYLGIKRTDLIAPNTVTGARKDNNKILYTNSFIK